MIEPIFINRIEVNGLNLIGNLDIALDAKNRKHLIFTGKNGSGKTTLLREISKFLSNIFAGRYDSYSRISNDFKNSSRIIEDKLAVSDHDKAIVLKRFNEQKKWLEYFGKTVPSFVNAHSITEMVKTGRFIIAYFGAKRAATMNTPQGISKLELATVYGQESNANNQFIQYIVNLKAERSFARDDNDYSAVEKIDQWFNNFENQMRILFEEPSLKLVFDRDKYNFNVVIDGKPDSTLNTLSDGYSAILTILTEVILRMEANTKGNYSTQGIVLIDEIETHLHVDLQKKILPFLTSFFPNIQFIITTHSPFVLSSISDAIICDLQNKIITEDLSGYSYDALIESYFSSDKYSAIVKKKIERYELISHKKDESNVDELMELKRYFDSIPKYFSKELDVKLQQIDLSLISGKV